MARWQTRAAIIAGTAGLVFGVMGTLGPKSADVQDRENARLEQQISKLADADDANKDRIRDQAKDGTDAENQRRLTPGEHRPPERPHVRIRLP